MSYTELLNLRHCSLGYATQADLVTPAAGSYTWLDAHDVSLTPEAPVSKPGRTVTSRGAAAQNNTGRRWYRLSFKTTMHGQPSDYAIATDTADLVGAWGLLTGPFASALGVYHATGVVPSDANTVTLTNNPNLGALMAFADSNNDVGGMGFISAKSGGGPYTTTLFEDLPAQPGNPNKQLPTRCLYHQAGYQPWSFSLRGEPTVQDMRIYGGVIQKVTFRFDEADALIAEWEFVCYAGRNDRGAAGGLQTIESYLTLDPFIGSGRVVLASNVFTDFDDGTADAAGHCDVRDIVMGYEWTHRVVECPTAPEGVTDVSLQTPRSSVSFTVPHIEDLEVSDVNAFEQAFLDRTKVSFSLYMGDSPGRLFAFQLPAAQVVGIPGFVTIDDTLARSVELEGAGYSGDGATTGAGNTTSRTAIG